MLKIKVISFLFILFFSVPVFAHEFESNGINISVSLIDYNEDYVNISLTLDSIQEPLELHFSLPIPIEYFNPEYLYAIPLESDGILFGDVNDDGLINFDDIILLLLYVSGHGDFGITNKYAADVNFDGVLDKHDVLLLVDYFHRWPVVLGYQPGLITRYFTCLTFRNYIRYQIGIPLYAGQIFETQVRDITEIIAPNKGLTSLDGIEFLTEIENIVVQNNHIEAIDVSNLRRLRHLNVANNELKSLDVTDATSLTGLSLSGNYLDSIEGLETLTSLRIFWAEENRFTSIQNLPNTPALIMVDVRGNSLPSGDYVTLPDNFDRTTYQSSVLPWQRRRITRGFVY